MSQSILYYPNISINDGHWLRNAIIYWDEVCSIVPSKGYHGFSAELLYLKERGMYRPIYPEDIFYGYQSHELHQQLASYITRLGHSNRKSNSTVRMHQRKICSPSLYSLIHHNKIPDHLSKKLINNNIIHTIGENGWMEVDERFANTYMRMLATHVAKYDLKNMVIGTDKQSNINKVYTNAAHKKNNAVISYILNECLPVPTMDVPFEEILDFKEKRKDELLDFREKIRAFERELSKCTEIEEIKDRSAAFKEKWESELIKSQKLFKGDGIGYAVASLTSYVGITDTTSKICQWVGEPLVPNSFITPISLAAGAIAVGIMYKNHKNKLRESQLDKGFAYIISANKNGLIKP